MCAGSPQASLYARTEELERFDELGSLVVTLRSSHIHKRTSMLKNLRHPRTRNRLQRPTTPRTPRPLTLGRCTGRLSLSMHGDEIECGVVYSHVSKKSPFRLEVAHKDNSTPSLHVRLAQSVDSSSGLRVCRGLKCPGGR